PAKDGGANAPTQDLPFVRRAKQVVHELHATVQPRQQLAPRVGRNVFVGEIDVRLDVGEGFHQVIAQLVDPLRQLARELLVGRGQRQFRARVDQVGYRFGLGKVQPPIKKRALGEFARLGQSR